MSTLKLTDLPNYEYDEYIKWEGRWEIIDGIPYAMSPAPNIKHQDISGEITYQLKSKLKKCQNCQKSKIR